MRKLAWEISQTYHLQTSLIFDAETAIRLEQGAEQNRATLAVLDAWLEGNLLSISPLMKLEYK